MVVGRAEINNRLRSNSNPGLNLAWNASSCNVAPAPLVPLRQRETRTKAKAAVLPSLTFNLYLLFATASIALLTYISPPRIWAARYVGGSDRRRAFCYLLPQSDSHQHSRQKTKPGWHESEKLKKFTIFFSFSKFHSTSHFP